MILFKCDSKNPVLSPSYFIDKAIPLEVQRARIFVTIGTMDPLIDDTLFMYRRWISSGGVHGFVIMPTQQSEEARSHALEFLKSRCI